MLYTSEYLLIMLIQSVWSIRGLDYVRKNIRWWQISFKFQWIHMFDEDQSWLPFLSNKIVLVPAICHYIRRPASWACNGQVHHDVVQFGFVLFCMWRIALPPCACQSLDVWLQSLWGDWLCKELNCVCCGHKGHVSGDAQIQHCAYDCFDRRQWIVLLGGGNSSTASATLSVIKCVGNRVSMEIFFLFVKFA